MSVVIIIIIIIIIYLLFKTVSAHNTSKQDTTWTESPEQLNSDEKKQIVV